MQNYNHPDKLQFVELMRSKTGARGRSTSSLNRTRRHVRRGRDNKSFNLRAELLLHIRIHLKKIQKIFLKG